MATGERIRFFRILRGMTQKYLGLILGFPDNSADVRLAQYESEDRTPKADLTTQLAEALDVSPSSPGGHRPDGMGGLLSLAQVGPSKGLGSQWTHLRDSQTLSAHFLGSPVSMCQCLWL